MPRRNRSRKASQVPADSTPVGQVLVLESLDEALLLALDLTVNEHRQQCADRDGPVGHVPESKDTLSRFEHARLLDQSHLCS